jgi:hypothetical protein
MTPNDRPMSAAPRETVTLAQLQSIEWCARSPFFTDIMVCPACRRPRPGRETEHRSGHDPDCWLAAAILSLRETPPAVPSPEAMPAIGWQPIATAPEDKWLLVYFQQFRDFAVCRLNDRGVWEDEDEARYTPPSHWQPLPEPPQ